MKSTIAFLLSFTFLLISCSKKEAPPTWEEGISYEGISAKESPFPMSDVQVPVFPEHNFSIADFGARPMPADGKGYSYAIDSARIIRTNTLAFARAMEACASSGGGRVIVPKGEWLTGPISLQSKCDLHLSEGSVLVFSGNPDDCLPEVVSSWEGYICMNYSPMIYALNCNNIAISGTGTIRPIMKTWREWFEDTPDHINGLKQLYRWGSSDAVFFERNISSKLFRMRPPLIEFVVCENVLLQDFSVIESPFWTIHMLRCHEGAVRRVNLNAHGKNNCGVALEMSRRFLIEDCIFDLSDDAVVLKSGRNQEGWHYKEPTQDILVRNCEIKNATAMLSVGTELSGGVRNAYIHDCKATSAVDNMLYIKTNRRRGAYAENIIMERCEAVNAKRALAIDTDVLYQWRDIVKTLKDSVTAISNITMRDIKCRRAIGLIDLNGDKDLPIQNVTVSNVQVDSVSSYVSQVSHVKGYKEEGISYKWYGRTGEKIDIPK